MQHPIHQTHNTPNDTTPEADGVLLQLLSQTPVWRKLQLMEGLNQMTHAVALGNLRQRYPGASAEDLQRLLADRLLGAELAARVYGPPPAGKETPHAV
jgi:hypothetical protein